MRISCHILAKEVTRFGQILFNAALENLFLSKVISQLIIVDNGCDKQNQEMLKDWLTKFSMAGTKTTLIQVPERTTFSKLRNLALQATDPATDYVFWTDTDETHYPETINRLNSWMDSLPSDKLPSRIRGTLYHFMIEPDKIQYTEPHFVIYKYTPELHWELDVHEHLLGVAKGPEYHLADFMYEHWGYTRKQFRKFLHWLNYAKLEHGNLNCYKEYNENGTIVDYLKDWRTPDAILEDRRSSCQPFKEQYSFSAQRWINQWKESGKTWKEWLAEIDPDEEKIWQEWQELAKQKGNWKDTLDPIFEKYMS